MMYFYEGDCYSIVVKYNKPEEIGEIKLYMDDPVNPMKQIITKVNFN